jgi:hypothetical protein
MKITKPATYLTPDDCHSTAHAAQYRRYRAMHEAELAERDATIERLSADLLADALDDFDDVVRLRLDLKDALNTIKRVKALIDPEAQMAIVPYGDGGRYFAESDLRAAIGDKP